jgi:MFS family permease
MGNSISKNKLFTAACISLIVTAMTFAIRAGILGQLGEDFEINNTQLGFVNAMAFWGFPVATIFGGFLYNLLGARKLMIIAFFLSRIRASNDYLCRRVCHSFNFFIFYRFCKWFCGSSL